MLLSSQKLAICARFGNLFSDDQHKTRGVMNNWVGGRVEKSVSPKSKPSVAIKIFIILFPSKCFCCGQSRLDL